MKERMKDINTSKDYTMNAMLGMSVLVAVDSYPQSTAICEFIDEMGGQSELALTIDDIFDKVLRRDYDAIIISLSFISGCSAGIIDAIRSKGRDPFLPIIGLIEREEDQNEEIIDYLSCCLPLPFTEAELFSTVISAQLMN